MEISLLKALLKSFSCFFDLSSTVKINFEPVRKCYQNNEEMLKLLNPVLHAVADAEIASDESLQKAFQGLSQSVDKLRELFEASHPLMSKVYFVLHVETFTAKVQNYGLKIFELLKFSDLSLPVVLSLASLENRIMKIKHMGHEQRSTIITKAIRDQAEASGPNSDSLTKIADSLSLKSNQELLIEIVALEKLKENAEQVEKNGEVEYIDKLIAVVTHMHNCFVMMKQNQSCNPVLIPADFCCPLSLELMRDPVIVASGQTYERDFIRKWIDNGLAVCPKTRQILSHNNLIPNYTVKALIANWCELNDVKLPDPVKSTSFNPLSSLVPLKDSGSLRNPHLPHLRTSQPASPDSAQSIGSPRNGHDSDIESSSEGRSLDSVGELSLSPSRKEFSSASVVDELSPQGHNRTTSASSALSTANFSQEIPGDDSNETPLQAVTAQDCEASEDLMTSNQQPAVTRQRETDLRTRSRSQSIWRRPSERFAQRLVSTPAIETRADLSRVEIQVRKLVEDMKSTSLDQQREATGELRLLAKHNMDNRIVIANSGAVSLLVNLLHSTDKKIQENAVTTLLNLSINDNNKTVIANAGAIDPLIHVLETGSPEAKENSAATLFSLSVIEDNKIKIGRSRAIEPLVDLLGNGTPRGKKDAATALFNLSTFHENKERVVDAGAVKYLVEMMDPAVGMVDKVVAVLSNLATIPKGRAAIGQEGGIIVLVEVVELGSARGKEHAAAALLQLCTNSSRFCNIVLQEGAIPPLVALSQSGTPRAKEKAQALLSYFRNQRHGNGGRG
ncbi:hypothetical protein LguiA_006060 [Lonicera macranthoides]